MNRKTKKGIIFFTAVFLLFVFPSISFAESIMGDLNQDIILSVNPKHPAPFQEVTVKAESYLISLLNSEISWYRNGNLIKKGYSETEFTFTTNEIGSTDSINVIVETNKGQKFSKKILIRVADVDLIWETNSSTPPFYKGKPLYSSDSDLRIVAIPYLINSNGEKIEKDKLVFNWEENWRPVLQQSGRGRDVYNYDSSKVYGDMVISVTISSLDGQIKTTKAFRPIETTPEVLIYEKDPLMGMVFERAINDSFVLEKEEISLWAQPYFFSESDVDSGKIDVRWSLNNKTIQDFDDFLITLKNNSENKGSSVVGVELQNMSRVLQTAKNILRINFEETRDRIFN